MIFKRITVLAAEGTPSKDVIGQMQHELLHEYEDHGVAIDFKCGVGETELVIYTQTTGDEIFFLKDARLVGIYAVVMRFVGYDQKGKKLHVNCFNK